LDEAGRGPLAGPVVASAVILPPLLFLPGLNDSKLVAEPKRTNLSREITARAQGVGIGVVDAALIDKYNILEATRMAMLIAIKDLGVTPDFLLIDAVKLAGMDIPQLNLIKGDRISASIAAASIIAKVHRDKLMMAIHREFPQYGFDNHKGYGTREHLEALKKFGPCPYHRRSFAPVRELAHG
jgi:ribonuclease HII